MLHTDGLIRSLMDTISSDIALILGPDVDVQRYPHLRITRPQIASDNLGLHRDIDYGASIYEISVWTPLVELNYPGVGMLILPKSNLMGYEGLKLSESETGIAQGSKKNISGHLYKAKNIVLSANQRAELHEPVVKLGQYLVIPQASVHGSEVNSSPGTRFSIDIRFCNSLVYDPKSTIEKRRGSSAIYGEDSYYTTYSESQTKKNALIFQAADVENSHNN